MADGRDQLDVPARIVFGLNALVVLAGLVIQVGVTATSDAGFFDTTTERVLNILCFFTIQSNILVGSTTAALALADPAARWRSSTWFRTLRLCGLVGITLTFVVFHTLLRGLQDLTGQAAVADFLLHTASPILCVAGWVWLGPRGQTSARVAWWTLAFVLPWGVFTLIRGHVVGFYPYPFMDPSEHGYPVVTVYLAIIGAVYVGLALGAWRLDGWLSARRRGTPAAAPTGT